ncbi:MAG: hypothetical protein Q4D96_10220 [Propionibacteriaceae bacterium]|nr:hypothetical protein [Propionibacteriaceae bacterium]
MSETMQGLTRAERDRWEQFDQDVTSGRVRRVGAVHHRDGSPLAETDLNDILRGRPSLGSSHASGQGRSPRRQVRLSEATNAALDAYAAAHGLTPSAVIRNAVEAYLAPHTHSDASTAVA